MTTSPSPLRQRFLVRTLPFVAGLAALLLVACGGSDARKETPAPAFPGDTWLLSYDVSGGIDGRSYGLKLASDGKASFTDKRANRSRTATLSAADLDALRAKIVAADLPSFKPPTPSGCADCIDVAISVTSGSQTYRATANEVNRTPKLDPLLAALNQLYAANKP
jgi:hypothetical protein